MSAQEHSGAFVATGSVDVVHGRVPFMEALGQWLSETRHGQIAAFSIDLGRLAHLNPSASAHGGFQVADAAVRRLSVNLPAVRIVGRLGGADLAVAMAVASADDAVANAKRMVEILEAPIRLDDGSTVRLGCFVGVATSGDADVAGNDLFHCADLAVCRAGLMGAEEYQMYTRNVDQNVDPFETQRMLVELHHAAELGQLSLAFQPKVDLRTRHYAGAEVLVRWASPLLGDVPPGRFIPLAEEAGLIRTIGKWVLREAVHSIGAHPFQVIGSQRLAVNISARQLGSDTFVPWLERLLDSESVPGSCLEFEITESALMANAAIAAKRLDALRALGATITLDDFGTGYSTFSHLRQLPIDAIKIAPEFVADITCMPDSGRLVAAMVNMARSLDLRVVAEGIETEVQADFLAGLGCHHGQGYLFGRPMNVSSFSEHLAAKRVA